MNFFSCDIDKLEDGFHELARKSYEKYGFFLLKNVLKAEEIVKFREAFDQLFIEPGDSRLRYLRNTKPDSDLRKKISQGFAISNLNHALVKIFHENDISLLPPFNIAKNYLPHSVLTRGAGWHRDVSGEIGIKECRELISSKDYVFGKVGIFFQKNSDYGGAIDVIPCTNNDFVSNSFNKYRVLILIKLLIFTQKYFPWAYKYFFRGSLFSNLLGSISLKVNAGDVAIFDSRIFHKGTFAAKAIEKKLKYDTGKLQADLPIDKTKYVLYSHFGNSVGTKSYFIDRLSRKDNEMESQHWIDDAFALSQSIKEIPVFFRKIDSVLEKSIF